MSQPDKIVISEYFCEECGEPCEAELVDFGIGSYEFWGQRGVDRQLAWVSSCCEAQLLDENGAEADPPEE